MYQEPPGQVPVGQELWGAPPQVVVSPHTLHGQLAANAGDGLNANPPTPTVEMAAAVRPRKLRRVTRPPTRLVVFSNNWSSDIPSGPPLVGGMKPPVSAGRTPEGLQ